MQDLSWVFSKLILFARKSVPKLYKCACILTTKPFFKAFNFLKNTETVWSVEQTIASDDYNLYNSDPLSATFG